jgi:uncharacterized membrane protein
VRRTVGEIVRLEQRDRIAMSRSDRIADWVTGFSGSMPFVYLHLVIFGCWVVANLGWLPGVPRWDPTLVVLAMVASVEAIFLTSFVLINQNQMTLEADEKAELDLQVGLLNEGETTRLLAITQAIAEHLGVTSGVEHELDELRKETQPGVILDAVKHGSGKPDA